jgi:hypothetical protein
MSIVLGRLGSTLRPVNTVNPRIGTATDILIALPA